MTPCAIYTRKSSEEGLEQGFNSLDAQRESCEAFILSQKSQGWKALPALYDDGGFSGGNMQRPAAQRLLADVVSGKIGSCQASCRVKVSNQAACLAVSGSLC